MQVNLFFLGEYMDVIRVVDWVWQVVWIEELWLTSFRAPFSN